MLLSHSILARLVAASLLCLVGLSTVSPVRPAGLENQVQVKVQVPVAFRSAPFNTDRFLQVPVGFEIAVFARVANARFLAVAPNGDLLVSQPGQGSIQLLRPDGDDVPQQFTFASGLSKPHDIVFHVIDGVTYVYVAEKNRVIRYRYTVGDTQGKNREDVVINLPDASLPELGGSYGHELKNIAIDRNHVLYVSIASASNADPADMAAAIKRGAVYVYDARKKSDAAQGRLFAQGIRNAEGLAFVPGSNDLWVVINNRDNIGYPFNNDWLNDGTGNDYGKVIKSYVDNHPPEEFTRVRDGGNYGWPFCNPNPDSGLNNMPFDRDVQTNGDGSKLDCAKADRIDKGIQAHSAPLGLTFVESAKAPVALRGGAIVGFHGSWNRTEPTGYKFAFFPWNSETNQSGDQIDLVSGWLKNGQSWGRPVDSAVAPDGAVYLSDDSSGTIYRLWSTAATFDVYAPMVNGAE